jgi:DNA-binding Lrp family transcriptional regulator
MKGLTMSLNDQELKNAITKGLENWHPSRDKDALESSPLRELTATREFLPQKSKFLSDPDVIGKAIRKLLEQGIERLEQGDHDDGRLLRFRYFNLRKYKDIAKILGIAPPTVFRRRRKAIGTLAGIIKEIEAETKEREQPRIATLKAALPTPTYDQLFGFSHYLRQVEEGLNVERSKASLPIVMTGLVGIGKTSLAIKGISGWLDKTLPLIDHLLFVRVDSPYVEKDHVTIVMDHIIFSLGQQLELPLNQLPNQEIRIRRLAEYLAHHPSLILIDNIETHHEVQATINLVRRIGSLAQIVITSRHEFDQLAVRPIILKELEQPDALVLLQAEAKRLRMEPLPEQTTNEIFTQVGGHPLALKLVIAQLRKLPLERVLRGLERPSSISDKLYHHIYETSWRLLDEISRHILLGLILLPPSGASWEWLELAVEGSETEADEHHIEEAIQELSTLNLLQISASQPPLYSLHQLTYRFLGWKSGLLQRED